ncbi:TIGR03364 family FAD-dependent oxidoreductase [Paraflavitalea pollutisoli]|uniref:TIGR03364 family FAD-dependent oxidoreductase n=1 Tax=Paraflavitalea pollutisoli TaxID=3034143 RepID=UPI0023ED5280|nr:TIGR03364 family FAD-dependent oxidoreductase [Paraflavitalea sp. H1-2-19X]
MSKPSAVVIGAGIVGLATARALALKGYAVKVFDRTHKAVGASIRNFGMVWPIGQPGKLYDRAMRSREIWKEIGDDGAFWYDPVGSLHVAYHPDEWDVLQELHAAFSDERPVELLSAQDVADRSGAVVQQGLLGGLYSANELIVDPREAIGALPGYLQEKYGVEFFWGRCVSYISENTVYVGNDEAYDGDVIFICSGADFETLYPEAYAAYPLTKCKLQMMRIAAQPDGWRIGPALCGGLSLIHYKSFSASASLQQLKKRYEAEMSEYLDWGIHVMVSQNGRGELTIGDSHEYGLTHDPFDKDFINTMILQYLRSFAQFKDSRIIESWNGIYPKLTNGDSDLFFSPEPAVYVLNGLSGAGMTLSFGLAEEATSFL